MCYYNRQSNNCSIDIDILIDIDIDINYKKKIVLL